MDLGETNRRNRMWVSLLLLAGGLLVSGMKAQTNVARKKGSELQRRYDTAQKYQAAHDLDHAAEQYRMFIAGALGELAVGRARADEYDKAADSFDEALRLVPDAPAMRIDYARTALESGKLERAKLLAMGVIRDDPSDPKVEADAHVILGRVLMKTDKDAEAKQQMEEAVALDPTFDNGYELAVVDLDMGDGNGAATIFTEMLASFGNTAAIHMRFGQAYLKSDFQANAVTEFQSAIAKDERLPGLHYSLAAAYLSTAGHTRLLEAEAELRNEMLISPKDAAAYAALGHLLAGQEHDAAGEAEAANYLKHATELDPKSPDGFLYLGQFYAQLKRTGAAEAALRQSIALTNDVSRNGYQVQKAHYLLGRLLVQTGETDEGEKEIAASQALMHQDLTRDQNRLSDYLQEQRAAQTAGAPVRIATVDKQADGDVDRQVDALEAQLGPAIADSYNNLGAIAGSAGNSRAALQNFEKAAEWNPALPGLDYNWGRAAFAAGAYAEAVGPLGRYLLAHPEDEGARAVLGLSQYIAKEYAGARKTLEPLDARSGEAPQLQLAYAVSLLQTGDTSDGVARLLALEKTNPNAADVHRALGEAYAEEKSPGAPEELEMAIRLNPSDVDAHVVLARLQLAKGDVGSAVVNLEAAVKLQPQNAELRKELEEARGSTLRK